MRKQYFYILPIVAMFVASCEPTISDEIDGGTYYAGEADFTTYVAIGNSLTAGYMDNSMYKSGQANSFPSILAKQFKIVGGGEFTQPSYEDDVNDAGGLLFGGNQIPGFGTRMVLNFTTKSPENLNKAITLDVTKLQAKAYNNAGVAGAKVFHLMTPGYGSLANLALGAANPYFVRTATTPDATVMGDAMSLKPTFFTNWIGANDVLAYATSGGEGQDQNILGGMDPRTYGGNDITNSHVFEAAYSGIVNTLTSNGAKGVVATIPDVTTIPFFTTVPYNPIAPALISNDIDQLNMFVGLLKTILTAAGQGDRIQMLTTTAANPLLIQDKTLTNLAAVITQGIKASPLGAAITDNEARMIGMVFGQARHAKSTDLILLTASGLIGQSGPSLGNPAIDAMLKTGVTLPLGDEFVLNSTEQKSIKDATNQFNTIIRQVANAKGLAIADMNAIMNKVVSGIRLTDGQIYTANYFNGSNTDTVLFSLDGVHMNPKGYAFVATEIIKTINAKYKSNIPLVDISGYKGISIVATNNN